MNDEATKILVLRNSHRQSSKPQVFLKFFLGAFAICNWCPPKLWCMTCPFMSNFTILAPLVVHISQAAIELKLTVDLRSVFRRRSYAFNSSLSPGSCGGCRYLSFLILSRATYHRSWTIDQPNGWRRQQRRTLELRPQIHPYLRSNYESRKQPSTWIRTPRPPVSPEWHVFHCNGQ